MSSRFDTFLITIADKIEKDSVYMFVFVGFGIGFLVIFSLMLALTKQAESCVSDKDVINTGYVFNSIGLFLSVLIIIFAAKHSTNTRNLITAIIHRIR